MKTLFYPALVFGPGEDDGYAAVVPGINVNGQGDTLNAALMNAAEILQDVVEHLMTLGEPIPGPGDPSEYDDMGTSTPAILQATIPAQAA